MKIKRFIPASVLALAVIAGVLLNISFINSDGFQLSTSARLAEYDFDPVSGAVIRYKGDSVNITVPEKIDGVTVKEIAEKAFSYTFVSDVTLPDTIERIGNEAFADCVSLRRINFPDSVTFVGSSAFRDCTVLTEISLPNNISSVSDEAFSGCSALKSVRIPYGVTWIGEYAFMGCESLAEAILPESLSSIESGAFCDCKSLKTVNIPDSVSYIGSKAFYNCLSLEKVVFTNDVRETDVTAFGKCPDLTIEAPKNSLIAEYALKNDINLLFSDEPSDEKVIFGDINGDGCINANDASVLLAYYAKISTGYERSLEDFVASMNSKKTP